MQPPRRGADALLHEGEKGDDVVARGALDLVDARRVSVVELAGAGPALGERFRGGDAGLHHALQCRQLDIAPAAEPGGRAPQRHHLRA